MTPQFGLRPRVPAPSLPARRILRRLASKPPTPTKPPVSVASTTDYLSPFQTWDVLGNNTFDNCNAVAWANQRRLVTATLGPKESYPNLDEVVAFYKTQNSDFDPNGTKETNGPKSKADNGMWLQEGLSYLQKNGGPDGVKPIAFAEVNPEKLDEVREAIAVFGSLWVGFPIYHDTDRQFKAHEPFHIPQDGSRSTGGHAVIVAGYVPNMKCVTWGHVHLFDDSYWSDSILQAWAVIWPEHVGTRSFMLGVNLGHLADEMKRLTGRDLDLPEAPFSSLYFVKTRTEAAKMTEVYVADSASSYASPGSQNVSAFQHNEAENGVFVVDDGDLYFVKLRNTDTGAVEVHRATASSGYKDFAIQTATAFSTTDADNGIWTVDSSDLYFIKTRNTGDDQVVIYRAGLESNYSKLDIQSATCIPQSDSSDGTWAVFGANLYFIKYRSTQSDHVEVHLISAGHRYQVETVYQTWFGVADGEKGTWDVGANGDLYFIKTKDTGHGTAEVHIATAESEYKDVSHYASWIGEDQGPNGTWCIR